MAGIPTSDIEYSFRTAASYRIRRSIDDSATDGKEFAPSVSSKKKIPGSKVKTGTVSSCAQQRTCVYAVKVRCPPEQGKD